MMENKNVSENMLRYRVDTQLFKIIPCTIENCDDGMARRIEDDGEPSTWQRGYKKENMLNTLEDAEKRLSHIKELYFSGFKRKPYLKIGLLEQWKERLLEIEKDISDCLSGFPNFNGIDFCDVGANGIQIRGHHKEISGYTYGDQPTINYDFSNADQIVNDFYLMWKSWDTPSRLENQKAFIEDGEKYGWD